MCYCLFSYLFSPSQIALGTGKYLPCATIDGSDAIEFNGFGGNSDTLEDCISAGAKHALTACVAS